MIELNWLEKKEWKINMQKNEDFAQLPQDTRMYVGVNKMLWAIYKSDRVYEMRSLNEENASGQSMGKWIISSAIIVAISWKISIKDLEYYQA